ncbi:MAG: hypothetical protein J0H48_10355 [Nitrosospira multiformis]|nr:hypothetical protein [Nitrosospira multiformis]
MNDDLNSRLEAIDADCERAAKAELDSLFETAPSSGTTSRGPSPQAAEAIWLRLIGQKEQEFIQEIRTAKQKRASGSSMGATGETKSVEETINDLLADERYLSRLREFYAQVAGEAVPETSQAQAKRLDLIDTTYRAGVENALRRARESVLVELNLNRGSKEDDASFLSQWKQYSTLSPWRSIWTIVLLSLTSYLIAFIIASEAFRALLERFGWSTGTGM